MLRRIIPVLLVKGKGLVKGTNFRNHRYVGDPINTVKIFNDKEVDELIVLDIQATKENRCIDYKLVRKLADECYMPFAVGGGINNINQIRTLIREGAEKVVLNSVLANNLDLVRAASERFGSQSIVACIDLNKNWFGKTILYSHNYTKKISNDLISWMRKLESLGAGEIIINCIHKDGIMEGYDSSIISAINSKISIPTIILGGAGSYDDLRKAFSNSDLSAVASGSLFVFHGELKAVLINYPSKTEKKKITGVN